MRSSNNYPPAHPPTHETIGARVDVGSSPCFELRRVRSPPAEPPNDTTSGSLAPVAINDDDDYQTAAESSRNEAFARRNRATVLFGAIMLPVALLALVEAAVLGSDYVEDAYENSRERLAGMIVAPGATSTQANASQPPVGANARLMSDDEARNRAASALTKRAESAQVACARDGMAPAAPWLTVSWASDGTVDSVVIEGLKQDQSELARCVQEHVHRTRIPAFQGTPLVTARRMVLR